jgi:hypothetical protein
MRRIINKILLSCSVVATIAAIYYTLVYFSLMMHSLIIGGIPYPIAEGIFFAQFVPTAWIWVLTILFWEKK